MRGQQTDNSSKHALRFLPRISLNIRGRIVIPYLFLTLIIAAVGIYVVTSLVSGSLNERLDNHLLESGRAVLNSLARYEIDHQEAARLVALTRGVAEALRDHDLEAVKALVLPAATTLNVDTIIVVDADGETMVQMLQKGGTLTAGDFEFNATDIWIIRSLLEAGDPAALPRRGIGMHPADNQYYYFTAVPVGLEDKLLGVVMIGTALNTLLPEFKSTSLAEVIIYREGGQAVASTFIPLPQSDNATTLLDALSISSELYQEALQAGDSTLFESVSIQDRAYRLARGPLMVGNERLSVFAVALPSNFIIDAGAYSRNTYVLIFTGAVAAVVLIGYWVAQRITVPLSFLVKTARAVADGDLQQRTGIQSQDEVGVLAQTFDQMTERLAERTLALERLFQAQKETATRMRAILSSIGDGVLLEDTEGNFVPLNAAAAALLEDLSDHFLNGPIRELTVVEQDFSESAHTNPWLLESRRFQIADKVFAVHSAVVATDENEKLGTVIVLRDVTAEVEADQLKDAFVAHVSHELRTPLTSIKGYSALLVATAGSTLSADQRDFLGKINRQTDNLVSMINALLDFSEVEAGGKLGLRQESVQLSELVESVAQEWRPKMESKALSLTVDIATDLPPVNADPDRLRWAMINLVSNAWQYTPAGGAVTLRLSSAYDRVVFDVIDTGVGISPGNQQRLFSRFYRIVQDQDDEVRGLGLGLYVTKAIVEAHGGYVQVVSEEGVGSTFSLVLPAARSLEVKRPVKSGRTVA